MAGKDKVVITLEGYDDTRRMLKDFAPQEANNIMRATVQKLAELAAGRMRMKVKRKTNRLARSIKAIRRRGQKALFVSDVRVGRTAPYGIILEFGTMKTPAQPYIVPTAEELRRELPAWYKEEFANRLAKALKRRAREPKKRRKS